MSLRVYSWLVVGGFLVAAFGVATRFPQVPVEPVIVLGALLVLSVNRAVSLPSGFMASAGLMIVLAAVVVFGADRALLGPLIVGAASALDIERLRRRRFRDVALSAAAIGWAAFAAAVVAKALPFRVTDAMPRAVAAAAAIAAVFVVINGALIVGAYLLSESSDVRGLALEAGPVATHAFPLAITGAFLGRLYLDLGPAMAGLMVVPIVVAEQAFAAFVRMRAENDAAIAVLVRALEMKDPYTAGHTERVARYSLLIGQELGFRATRAERLRIAALMHDIGKLAIPTALLNKPDRLTADEYALVREHERVGVEMLRGIEFLEPIAAQALVAPPERRSARRRIGPRRARAGIEADIIAVADAYDAMTSTRAYRQALTQSVAFAELRAQRDSQFDAQCVESLIAAIERRGERHGAGHERELGRWSIVPPQRGVGSAGLGDLAPPDIDLTTDCNETDCNEMEGPAIGAYPDGRT